MEQLFVDRLNSEPALRLWVETATDLATSAPKEHWHTLLLDVKHGIRVLAVQPAFTALAIFVMAAGIASSVSIFSFANAVLFRSLPYLTPERLVFLWSPNRNFKGVPEEIGPNLPDVIEWQRRSRSFAAIAPFSRKAVALVSNNSSTQIGAAAVTGTFFATLGVSAQLGRVLGPEDDRAVSDHEVVISNALWRSRFEGSPSVIGKVIQLGRQKYTIVGVMPSDFGFPLDADVPYERPGFKQTDVWFPAAFTSQQKVEREESGLGVDAIARLRPGITSAQAQRELIAIQSSLQPLYPPTWRGSSAKIDPFVETIIGPVTEMFWILLSAVGVVLLISIVNTANLLLARTAARAHEFHVRIALGAAKGRLIRQLLTESLLLSGGAGVLAIALSYLLIHVLATLDPGGIPRFEDASLDGRVLSLAVLLSILSGVLTGLAPALLAGRSDVLSGLRNGGRGVVGGFLRARTALIMAEVALSVVLLAASGLLIRSYLKLAAASPGFSPATLTFKIELDERYNTTEQRSRFYRGILSKFKAIPAVSHVGASNGIPLTGWESVSAVEINGAGVISELIQQRSITPDYRQALGIPLLRGRDFSERDGATHARVALVNERFVAAYLKGREPIGTQIRIGIGNRSEVPWSIIVGVLANTAHDSLEDRERPQVFLPASEGDRFAIACRISADQVASQLSAVLHSTDPVLSIADVRTMRQRMDSSNARLTFETVLLTWFSGIAVCLALAGIYGLVSYLVHQRTPEIGVRLALGSSKGSIMRIFLFEALRLAAIGLMAGIFVALALTHLLTRWLFGVTATDPLTFIGVPLLIILVACAGSILPAWNATRVDPVQALRNE